MGCKSRITKEMSNSDKRFNRNIMGCKFFCFKTRQEISGDLIGT